MKLIVYLSYHPFGWFSSIASAFLRRTIYHMRTRFLTILTLVFELSGLAKDAARINLQPPKTAKISEPINWAMGLKVINGVMAEQDLPKIDELNQLSEMIGWPAAVLALGLQKKERLSIEESKSSMDLLFEDSRIKKERLLRESIIKLLK
jgi:hypothetical protein